MTRRLRVSRGGYVYRVLNRAAGRARILRKARDYEAFEGTLPQVGQRVPMRVLAWCLMPDHWHLVALAARRRRLVGVHALADGYARPTLARRARHRRHGARPRRRGRQDE
ncbi:MAG: transposase [Pirellulales bacterium]